MGKQRKQWQTLFSWAPKSLQMVTAAMKLKDACSFEEKLWPTLKWKVLVTQLCTTLCDPMDCRPPGSSVHGILQERILEPFSSPGDLPKPGIEHGFPTLQADSLPTELPRRPQSVFNWLLFTINCGKSFKRWEYQTTWSASWEICMQVRKQQLELDMKQQTGSK